MEKKQKEQAELNAGAEECRKRLAGKIRLAMDTWQWMKSIQKYRTSQG